MPIKCKCKTKEVCNVHDTCKCGNIKKVISETCKICYYKSLPKYECYKCGKKRKKTTCLICRECYNKQRKEKILLESTPIKEFYYSCGDRNKYNGIRSRARQIFKTLNIELKCSCCNFPAGVEICHIKPICKFDDETPINIVNDISNLILLCRNCHWLFDHGYPSIETIRNFYISCEKYFPRESNPPTSFL